MRIIPFEEKYRDDMIFMVLLAREALGVAPKIREDLLDVRANYLDKGDGFWLALDEGGRVVGCIGCSAVKGTREAFLHRLFVKPTLKRRGIGSALLEMAEAHLRASGVAVARVHLGAPPEQWFESYRFYPKHGYVMTEPRYMMKNLI